MFELFIVGLIMLVIGASSSISGAVGFGLIFMGISIYNIEKWK
jgi:hypothetical protein